MEHSGSTKVRQVRCKLFEEAREGKARTGGWSNPFPLSSHLRALAGKLIGAAGGIISRCGEIEPTPHEMRKKQVNWLWKRGGEGR